MEGNRFSVARQLSRRHFLAGAIAAGIGVEGARAKAGDAEARYYDAEAPYEPFSPSMTDTIFGRVKRVISPERLELQLGGGRGVASVRFEPGALILRDGLRTEGPIPLSALVLGDEVVVEGEWSGDEFIGRALGSLLVAVDNATITRRGGPRIETANRPAVRLNRFTRFRRKRQLLAINVEEFKQGETISAIGRIDSRTGELVAMSLFDERV